MSDPSGGPLATSGAAAAAPNHGEEGAGGEGLIDILAALRRLDETLASLSPAPPPPLAHYRRLPPALQTAYQWLEDGARLVHATSTKLALLSKIEGSGASASSSASASAARDLLRGCQTAAAAAAVLAQRSGAAAARYAVRAARGVIRTSAALVEATASPTNSGNSNVAAQRAGAVWEACDAIVSRTGVPRGNRSAMRRDLLSLAGECQDTIGEFHSLLLLSGDNNGGEAEEVEDDNDDDPEERYSFREVDAATAGVALVKCSKGTLNLALQACEAAGEQLEEPTSASDTDAGATAWEFSESDDASLAWMARLHELARTVGLGATDLGAALYPPLRASEVSQLAREQAGAIRAVLSAVADCPAEGGHGEGEPRDLARVLGTPVADLHAKLSEAVEERLRQITEALEPLAVEAAM